MTLTDVENLLAERLGFDIHSIGQKAIATVVRQSMKEAGFSDVAAYARALTGNSDVWDSLVDRVVIPETWFFRDIAPFELVGDLARAHFRRVSSKILRILSCPCSTGEEPYSLVMTMLHAGAPADSFTVDALDVSPGALRSAEAAAFSKRSFRGHALWYRAPYFDEPEGNGMWRLKRPVVAQVRFRGGNLVAPDFLQDDPPYDIVFCRNLLIYLHPRARLLAISALRRLVAENGVLVLGHAETAFAREHGFKQTGPASAFAFVKQGVPVTPKSRSEKPQNLRSTVAWRPSPAAPGAALAIPSPPNGAEDDLSLLIIARQMGDAGQLHDALRLCREHLQRIPDSAEGHFLLGVLHDAMGNHDLAIRSLRKTLYLNPAHRDALLHLALKQEARGDGSGAALLRERARRSPDDCTTE